MKRFIAFLLLSLSLGTTVQAQTFAGLIAGISASDFTSPHFSSNVYHTRPALIGGMALGRQLSKKLVIQGALLYSRQGAEIHGESIGVRLNYLNLPLQLKYFPFLNTFLGAGIQYGYLVSEDRRLDSQGPELPPAFLENTALRSHDLTLPVSVGYLSELGVQLEVRYHLGLVSVFKNPLLESRNRTVQFTVTYFLAGKKATGALFTNQVKLPRSGCH